MEVQKERKKETEERKKERKKGNILAMDYCVECGHEFGNRQLIRCDVCSCGVHRLCGTGKYIFFYNILHRV